MERRGEGGWKLSPYRKCWYIDHGKSVGSLGGVHPYRIESVAISTMGKVLLGGVRPYRKCWYIDYGKSIGSFGGDLPCRIESVSI